jgi:hydrogenase/urease accessory protein HupE
VQLLLLAATGASGHALQPGFLDIEAAGQNVWRVTWRVPDLNGAAMPLRPLLPEGCDIREPRELRFDGAAHVALWQATCPDGIAGGMIRIEGLENTRTDVLVRYELAPGRSATLRLTASETAAELPQVPSGANVLVSYVALGFEHIMGGIDHLLFVFALLMLVPDVRRLFWAITAFTLAHSLTLASATMGWLVVPSPPIEAVIALSIMFLAAELARPGGSPASVIMTRPWIASFGFGLLHGLGFAGALVEIGLPEGEVPLALFSFNLGVEIGQLLFVAAILAIRHVLTLPQLFPRLVASVTTPGRGGRIAIAYAIGTVSSVWFVSRIAAF